jgi:nucleotide-binding universal stress UspA family protein
MFRKILMTTDGSDAAMRALEVASGLALQFDAELAILHAMENTGSSRVPEGAQWLSKIEHVHISESDAVRSAADRIVNSATARAQQLGVSKLRSSIRTGQPAEVIRDYAAEHDVDLIVMGRRGLGRVSDLLLGSVSHRVTQLADCACLTMK